MNKVFYGPTKEFKKVINESKSKTLLDLAHILDSETREHTHRVEGQEKPEKEKIEVENFIIYAKEYSSVRENVILNINSIISNFNIQNLYVQNPPESILNQLNIIYANNLKIEYYKYNNFKMDDIKKINNEFSNVIIGQEKVKQKLISSIFELIRRKDNKPVVLMLYGPSGVGKTETAKYLSNLLDGKLFRKQFSMFQNSEFLSYLFGGSYGQESFARDLLSRETNIILLDEFDKAPKTFHSAFYQIFDEGIFEDKNYKVNLSNTLIICTSNYENKEEIKENLGDAIYYRFNSFIEYLHIKGEDLDKIINIKFKKILDEFEPYEIKLIQDLDMENKIISNKFKISNVRNLEQVIRDSINGVLINELLNK